MVENGGGREIAINRVNAPGGNENANGNANCGLNRIEIRNDIAGDQLRDVARHEMGHQLGFMHTGRDDSFDGNTPTMATCLLPGSTERVLSQDDAGKITQRMGSAPSLHPNWGFEQHLSYWGFSGGHSKLIRTGSAHHGQAHLGWSPGTNQSNVFQTVSISRPPSAVRARVSLKKQTAATTQGFATVEIYSRPVAYAEGGNCTWPTGKNQNIRSAYAGFILRSSGTYTPTTTWQNRDYPVYDIPTSPDGFDLRIRVRSTVRASDGYREIGIDNARIIVD